jgi:8-oxo-dGTP pyrophosphatase MutT (NUDIX family)
MFQNNVSKYGTNKSRLLKKSAGVACIRFNKNELRYEVLMVRKRYSYCFAAFVFGRYNKRDENYITILLNGMTNQEKLDVLSLNFDLMWWRIWLDFPNKSKDTEKNWTDIYKKKTLSNYIQSSTPKTKYDLYLKKKAKFKALFSNNALLLDRLIKRSNDSSELLWEIPKGRIERNESNLDCALRELKEETGIDTNMMKILPDIKPFIDEFTHMGVRYNSYYYTGIVTNDFEPKISFSTFSQLIEIDDVKWVSLDELKYMNKSKTLHVHLLNIFKIIKNRYNKYIKELDIL